jgi:CheY-like chemotaxis protein/Tfp pilus assembly protein PilZ
MKKIIIADDNKTFLMYLGLLLKRLEFQVMPAESGIDVLRLARLAAADVILLDIHMTGLDGFAVLRHIKEDAETSHIPVIMLSGDASEDAAEKCRQLGCFDYLKKPLRVDQLHDSLQRCFFSKNGTNRKHLRVSFNKKVILTYGGHDYELYTETLSEGGIYVRKEDPFAVGSEVVVQCRLGERGTVRVKGNVIYTKKLFGDFLTLPPGMAIAFNGISPDDAKALKGYIEDIMAKDIFESQGEELFKREESVG